MEQQHGQLLILCWLLAWCTKHHPVWNCSLLHSVEHK